MTNKPHKIRIAYVGSVQSGAKIDGIITYTTSATEEQVKQFIDKNWLDESRVVIGGDDESLMLDFSAFSAFNYSVTEIQD